MQTIKVLLLGAGESGKSTIFKQIQIHNTVGFTPEDYKMWRDRMWIKLMEVAQTVLSRLQKQEGLHAEIAGEQADSGALWDDLMRVCAYMWAAACVSFLSPPAHLSATPGGPGNPDPHPLLSTFPSSRTLPPSQRSI